MDAHEQEKDAGERIGREELPTDRAMDKAQRLWIRHRDTGSRRGGEDHSLRKTEPSNRYTMKPRIRQRVENITATYDSNR